MVILGIDFGDVRTGFAISDALGFAANTLPQHKETNLKKVAIYAADLANEKKAEKIVVGFPKNMNGSIGERGEKTKLFVSELESLIKVPVILWDERLTTVSAHNLMNETNVRGKSRKACVDSVSAAFILQSYLDSIR